MQQNMRLRHAFYVSLMALGYAGSAGATDVAVCTDLGNFTIELLDQQSPAHAANRIRTNALGLKWYSTRMDLEQCERLINDPEAESGRVPLYCGALETVIEWLMEATFQAGDPTEKVWMEATRGPRWAN